jgi:hypothetical protein
MKNLIQSAVFTGLLFAGLAIQTVEASSHNEKSSLRKCAGRYVGFWKTRKWVALPSDGVRTVPNLPIHIVIPKRGIGRADGKLDDNLPPTPPNFIPLTVMFTSVKIRRGGKLKIYRGDVVWKRAENGGIQDWTGTIKIKVRHKGSRFVVEQGNLQLFDYGIKDLKYYGQIRAKKR